MGRGQSIPINGTEIHVDQFRPEGDADFGFSVGDDVGESVFAESAKIPHRHPFYEIIFIDEADGEHIVDNKSYGELRNVVFLISPGQTHYWKNVTYAKGMLVYFNEDFLFKSCISVTSIWEISMFKEIAKMPAIYMDSELARLMRSVGSMMIREYGEKRSEYAEVLRACLNIMMIQFHRQTMGTDGMPTTTGTETSLYMEFQNMLQKRVRENLSVQQYAESLGVSSSHLNEQVKKVVGRSVSSLIHEAQQQEAKRLLLNTELNVTEIAERMNFQDTAYFCRSFKREAGVSPGQYRAEYRKKRD